MARIIQRLRELEQHAPATPAEETPHDPDLAPLAAPPPLEIPALETDDPSADLLEHAPVRKPADAAHES